MNNVNLKIKLFTLMALFLSSSLLSARVWQPIPKISFEEKTKIYGTQAYRNTLLKEIDTKRILILHSYHKGYIWTDLITKGIEGVFKEIENIDLYYEYMDSKRQVSQSYFSYLVKLYREKYKRNMPHVIICSDNRAYDFIQKYRASLFPGIPVVFCGLNNYTENQIKNRSLTTGILEATSERATIELALDLHKNTKAIAVITDNTRTGQLIRANAQKVHKEYYKKYTFTYLHDLSLDELLDAVDSLKSNTLILFYLFSKDATERTFPLIETMTLVASRSRVPIYTFWSFYLGKGALGGKVIYGESQGEQAGIMAYKFLVGVPLRRVAVKSESANNYFFDQSVMRKFNINHSSLPSGSIVINRELSFFDTYKELLWFITGIITLLVSFIFILVVNVKHRFSAEETLKKSEKDYKQLYGSMLDGFVRFSKGGRVVQCNAAYLDLLGYSEKELLGKHYLEITSPEYRKLQKNIVEGQVQKQGFSDIYEKEYLKKDGNTVSAELRTHIIDDTEKGFQGFWSIVRDITERKKNEKNIEEKNRELQKRNDELMATTEELEAINEELITYQSELLESQIQIKDLNESLEERVVERTQELSNAIDTLRLTQDQLIEFEKMASLGGLVAGIAHEINTPIGVSVTAASYLEEQTQEMLGTGDNTSINEEVLNKYLVIARDTSSMMLRNLHRAGELIQNFKEVAVDQSDEKIRDFNLKEYVDEILSSLNSEIKKKNHSVTVHCPEDIYLVSYPGVFFQIITNFIMNSLKHGFEGSSRGEMIIDFSLKGESLYLTYSDTGKGMNDEQMKNIFEPFYTTKRGKGGTGLGMHIVYNLVSQKMKGKISCTSTPGEGVIFNLDFPVTLKK